MTRAIEILSSVTYYHIADLDLANEVPCIRPSEALEAIKGTRASNQN